MALYNKAKFYLEHSLDPNKNYTKEEMEQLIQKQKQLIEPVSKDESNVLGEYVQHEGNLLLDSVETPNKPKRGRPKKIV